MICLSCHAPITDEDPLYVKMSWLDTDSVQLGVQCLACDCRMGLELPVCTDDLKIVEPSPDYEQIEDDYKKKEEVEL